MICLPTPDAAIIERRTDIVRGLRELVRAGNVIEDDTRLAAYETDALTAYRQRPLAVVLPETTAEVAAILAFAHRENVKVVPRGAGTSLSGGAIPAADAIVVALGKFNRILEVDYVNRCVVAQCGVTNLAISGAVDAAGDSIGYVAGDHSQRIAEARRLFGELAAQHDEFARLSYDVRHVGETHDYDAVPAAVARMQALARAMDKSSRATLG